MLINRVSTKCNMCMFTNDIYVWKSTFILTKISVTEQCQYRHKVLFCHWDKQRAEERRTKIGSLFAKKNIKLANHILSRDTPTLNWVVIENSEWNEQIYFISSWARYRVLCFIVKVNASSACTPTDCVSDATAAIQGKAKVFLRVYSKSVWPTFRWTKVHEYTLTELWQQTVLL